MYNAKKAPKLRINTQFRDFVVLVRETGLEPVRDYHTPLKRARLPIPPLSQMSVQRTNDIIAELCINVNT